MKQRCVIFYANPYQMTDEITGEVNEGISCTYLPSIDLVPVVNDKGQMGIATVKQSVPADWLDKFDLVPGIYDIDFKMESVGGKPMLKPTDFHFVSGVKFTEVK